jgi:hypothetical protein
MRRYALAVAAVVIVTFVGVALASQTPSDLRATADDLRSSADSLDAAADYVEQLENTPPVTVTETTTATVTTTQTVTLEPPTTTASETIPLTADLQPQRTPQQAASNTFYLIDMRHLDLPSGPAGLLWRQSFPVSGGWEFFDRWHYSCVSMYLQHAGARVAQIVYRTAEGQAYTQLNDAHGNEMGEGAWTGFPSRCALEQGPGLGPQEEIEEKPAGLQDEVVRFESGGVTFATFVCPATSPRNADTWCEVDKEDATANHVTLEVYWEDDLIVRIDIDRMSPDVQIVA